MRLISKGHEFKHLAAEDHVDDRQVPVFSEAFLYERMSKDDARFILAIADEYEDVIRKLGPEKVQEILRTPKYRFRNVRLELDAEET